LHDRIIAIGHLINKIDFIAGDAFDVLKQNLDNKDAYFFIDQPYIIAEKRLYIHSDIDHEYLFYLTSQLQGKFMLTYDNTDEIQ